jgi:hypothetical protein
VSPGQSLNPGLGRTGCIRVSWGTPGPGREKWDTDSVCHVDIGRWDLLACLMASAISFMSRTLRVVPPRAVVRLADARSCGPRDLRNRLCVLCARVSLRCRGSLGGEAAGVAGVAAWALCCLSLVLVAGGEWERLARIRSDVVGVLRFWDVQGRRTAELVWVDVVGRRGFLKFKLADGRFGSLDRRERGRTGMTDSQYV